MNRTSKRLLVLTATLIVALLVAMIRHGF